MRQTSFGGGVESMGQLLLASVLILAKVPAAQSLRLECDFYVNMLIAQE